jgi:biotin transport system permease protein
MNPAGVYVAGESWLHRMSAGIKVVGLFGAVLLVLLARTPLAAGAALLVSVLMLASARLPWPAVRGGLRGLSILLVVVFLAQWWAEGPLEAAIGLGRVAASVLLAWTVSMTTRVSAMLAVLEAGLGPLRVLRVSPERAALTVALAIRCVPMLLDAVRQADDARLARGARRSVSSLAVPVVIRSLRMADGLGEALAARGHPRSSSTTSRSH